ncbi:hypothetical protein [Actinacidiphila acidipaludis]|uniref:HSP18 transcriptional regulator n=1 Tax=Actinacidiphila acidipaludis TaxID=2873382 RepID=A0ABS7QLF4_9ACTN|nr:hypothetical protein [Streptomyces acidipaludis]MBY8882629.1 hypothetical protein [Streptomyces acidipaludis]
MAAAAALAAIDDAVRAARDPAGHRGREPQTGPENALAAVMLLRELRTELAGWEVGLVETARAAGATWADLAHPMGVSSRQAAENRYLRLQPAGRAAAATGAERVKAVRDRRAADRTVSAWARANAADLRVLAAQIAGLTDLGPAAGSAMTDLHNALGAADVADLVMPLAAVRPHLGKGHDELALRLDAVRTHAERLRRDSDHRRA